MHAALAVERIHLPKNHVEAVYDEDRGMAVVNKAKGQHFRTVGKAEGPHIWLLPEEALYLLERGTLDIRWPVKHLQKEQDLEDVAEEEQVLEGVPMSLQGAYAAFIGMDAPRGAAALTLERYVVYAALKRLGYIVLRADEWDGVRRETDIKTEQTGGDLLTRLWRLFFTSDKANKASQQLPLGPLVTPGLYRSYGMRPMLIHLHLYSSLLGADEIYRMLQIFPRDQSVNATHPPMEPIQDRLYISFNVYKPSPTFRKSAPGPPDFQICVLNCRETSVPTLSQLTDLFPSLPRKPPPEGLQMYQRLKHGHRNVVLAVVDQGIVSYIKIAEPDFAAEKLYERRGGPRGGKRGGFRKGRGRGGRR